MNAVIQATRYRFGQSIPTTYIATQNADGMLYFNDDKFFRCKNDGTQLQVKQVKRDIWTPTILLSISTIDDVDVSHNNNAGIVSPNSVVEDAIQWCIMIANDETHGYDQENRTGPDYDCSSLMYTAFINAGVQLGRIGSTATMHDDFDSTNGFQLIYIDDDGADIDVPIRGDVLWRRGHTELYLGNYQTVGAHNNEFGGIMGGQTGDQTGDEISVRPWNGRGYTELFRYTP